ncbi:MAG TPA: T9SS type A sorting domain-containing protein [Saprospiraceae bacterium]|nr:T9SS type A sorting domain-containing protein [Saprospiraceae bacterium]
MKIQILLILSLILSHSYAQIEYAPIGAKWTYEVKISTWMGDEYFKNREIKVSIDTTIYGKKCKKLISRELDTDKNEQKTVSALPDEYIYQDGFYIYRFLKDSFYLLYDFSGGNTTQNIVGLSMEDHANINRPEVVPFELKEYSVDSSLGFSQIKQKLKPTCFFKGGEPFQFERFGTTNDYLFYAGFNCKSDRNIFFKLRCFFDPVYGLINYDSIPCDSIRPDIIRTNVVKVNNNKQEILESNIVKCEIKLIKLENNPNISFNIVDVSGRLVIKDHIKYLHEKTIDVSHLDNGIYYFSWKSNNSKWNTCKWIKLGN